MVRTRAGCGVCSLCLPPPYLSESALARHYVTSDIWVKTLHYLAAVARWILKQLTSAKNRQRALSHGFCQKTSLFAVRSPAVCASCGRRGLQCCPGLGACFSPGSRRGTAVLGRGLKRSGVIFFALLVALSRSWAIGTLYFSGWVSLSHARAGVAMAGAINALASKELWGLTLWEHQNSFEGPRL